MSAQMLIIKGYFKTRKALGLARLGRKARPAAKPTATLLKNTEFASLPHFGFEVNEIRPKTQANKVIIYLHGGGYVNPIAKQHWQLIEELVNKSHAIVLVPRYGLAPEHNVSSALELVSKVFDYAKTFELQIQFAGDSAGGGLAVSSIAHLGLQSQVSKLALISPWLESEFSEPELSQVEKHDPWLIPENLRTIAAVWSGVGEHQDPRVSPLKYDLTGFPKTLVMMGQWDVLLFGARKFAGKAHLAQVEIRYEEIQRVLHVYPLLPTPEGIAARARLLEFINS